MKHKSKTNKGFTLVELLAVIIIIGILLGISIVAVMRYIDKTKNEQMKSQEKTLTMAARNYLQDNRGLLPKSIGETTTVPISVLKNNKYLTEDIKNSKKESCMTNSYVTTKKESKTKYSYKAYLYCGSDKGSTTVAKSTPTIRIDFVDASGNSINNDPAILEKVSEAKFVITYGGGTRDNVKVGIEGYSYSILVKLRGEEGLREVYSSGTLNANHANYIYVDRDNNLKDYIDISGETTVAIKATVRNEDGGVNNKITFIGDESSQASVVYHDKTPPSCVAGQTMGEASENDWINRNNSSGERKITVVCKDGSGSGCVRSTFTKTWSGDTSHEYDTIRIKDNAGNTQDCRVRVNIDKGYPVIGVEAYAKGEDGDSTVGNNILRGTNTTANSSNGSGVVYANEYNNLVSGYMNFDNFPNGVIYKFKLSDDVELKNWKWEVNAKNITSTSASNYETVSSTSEAKSGSCSSNNECDIYVSFTGKGLRKGVLTVYDKAGNKSTFTVYANISNIRPQKLSIINSTTGDETGDWTRSSVSLTINSDEDSQNIRGYYYTYNANATKVGSNDNTEWVELEGGTGINSFTPSKVWTEEMNKKVYIRVCDTAGNCSLKSSTEIKIDRTAPTGMVIEGYKKKNSNNIESSTDLSTIASGVWHNGWVLVVPSGATDSGSGGVYYKVTVTGASENVSGAIQGYRNVNAEGVTNVSFAVCDKVDNCSAKHVFVVKLDRSGPPRPTISNPSNGVFTKSSITLTIGSSDPDSGIGSYYYSYSSSASEIGSNLSTQWVEMPNSNGKNSFESPTWSDDINKTVYIKACDIVGNCSSVNSTPIRIDNNPPTVPIITNPTNGNWTNANFKLTLQSTDAGAGLADYQYTYNANATTVGTDADNEWKSNGQIATEEYLTTEFSAERNQKVYWRACDALGNCSNSSNTMIKLDKTPPVCGNINVTTNNSADGVSGTIACSDDASSCLNNSYEFNSFKSTDTVSMTDNAGNTRNCPISVTEYDCSTYAEWQYISVYSQSNNNCPSDSITSDYTFTNCSEEDFTDLCGSACAKKCSNLANCKYVCCLRRRIYPKTCYQH